MVSINNSGMVNVCLTCGCNAYTPLCAITYTPASSVLVVRDTSTYDAGDSALATVVTVTDSVGNFKTGRCHNSGSGATFGTVTFSSGAITGVPVSAGGTGYCGGGNGTLNITLTGGGGTGAIVRANVTAGVIVSCTVVAGGSSYASAPTAAVQINTTVIDLTGLSMAGGINITAVNTSTNRCFANLYMYNIPNATLSTTLGDSTDEVNENPQDTE